MKRFGLWMLLMWQLVPAAAANEDILIITSVPDVNVTLNCAAKIKPGLQYHAVRWYKETGVPRLSGLVSKTLPDGQMMWYVDADTRVSLEEGTLNLRLPTVTCSDQAVYQCYLAAPVGEQNRKGRVRLSVTGCPTVKPAPAVEAEQHRGTHIESTPLEPQRLMTRENLILCGAVGLLLSALMLFLFSCRSLKKTLWTQNKTPGKGLYPDPNSPPEKQDLLWIQTLGPPPKKLEPTAA
ncbi:uncharacterized protein LOC117383582 [Periophthalmus magnuspinnatus]|uniref:uncharacterized protein LOC117383582 n=1 Tax=Periophthalmus magnuspinnatus TaxID=409849 RepID=UPI00145A7956|nr:uncharacterized protein LOC117383582 [Periophthalmus magnuspinnatus]